MKDRRCEVWKGREASLTLESPAPNPSSPPEPSKSYNNHHTSMNSWQPHTDLSKSTPQAALHCTVGYSIIPTTFFLEVITGGDVSRTSPQSPGPGSSRQVLGVQEDQAGRSVLAAPGGPLSPADLATLLHPRLPARHETSPQQAGQEVVKVKMLDQRGSYLRSGRAADARLPLVDTTTSGQLQQ